MSESAEFDRAHARRLASRHSDEIGEAVARGENVHQLNLDQQEEVDRLVAHLPPAEQERFFALLIEETEAITRHRNDQTAALLADTARMEADLRSAESQGERTGKAIVYGLAIAVVVALFLAVRYYQNSF